MTSKRCRGLFFFDAAEKNHIPYVRRALEDPFDLIGLSKVIEYAIFIACKKRYLHMLDLLCWRGLHLCNLQRLSVGFTEALFLAVEARDLKATEYFLSCNFVHVKTKLGKENILDRVRSSSTDEKMLQLLLQFEDVDWRVLSTDFPCECQLSPQPTFIRKAIERLKKYLTLCIKAL